MNYTFAVIKDNEDADKARNFLNLASDYIMTHNKKQESSKILKLLHTLIQSVKMNNHIFEKDENTIILWRKCNVTKKGYIKTYPVMYIKV